MDPKFRKPLVILFVSSTDSVEFARLSWALSRSAVVGLDAEWKPTRVQQSTFPTVSLLQIACRLAIPLDGESTEDLLVFLIDLLALPLPSIWELLSDLFVSPAVLKLGFRFKQDLKYLSSTFSSQGCDPGFDRVEPFLDITSIYSYLQPKQLGRRTKETKSLATICAEVLGISLSKELQCSDWSCRPLTKEQKIYAAADAHCLLEIFAVFQLKVGREDNCSHNVAELQSRNLHCGLKEILEAEAVSCCRVIRNFFPEASSIIRATAFSDFPKRVHIEDGVFSTTSCRYSIPMHESLFKIVRNYGEKIILKETDKKPKTSKRKGKRQSSTGAICREKRGGSSDDWQGLPPWDLSLGGDGCPKFLCDVMVEGLAKHLRCVGIDAAVPLSKKPESRELIEQAHKEKRVLLTRDAKLLRHDYLLKNQIYKVRSLLKNEQLLEVIETFQLKICEDQLMSRCTKCNGRFIQKPLTTEEAIEASKGFQVIPNCLFNKNIEFWQCMDCNQLYWEGTQYHNAVQKFIDVCKLN